MEATAEVQRGALLSQLSQSLPLESLVMFAGESSRPDLIVADEAHWLTVIDVEPGASEPTARESIARLNQKVADLREEIPAVERLRPHRLVFHSVHPGPLVDQEGSGSPRALGLAHVERSDWLKRIEPCALSHEVLNDLRPALAPMLRSEVSARRVVAGPGQAERERRRFMLDAWQSVVATAPVDDILVVTGLPGTGKTLALAGRARYLARHPVWRIVILCYNNAPPSHLHQMVEGCANIEVTTFRRFTRGEGHHIALDDEKAAAQIELARRKGISQIIDALLNDEGQDFRETWVSFAIQTLRRERGGTIIAADERQALYRDAPLSQALAGRQVSSLVLERPNRTTRLILSVASSAGQLAWDGLPVGPIWAGSWDGQAAAAARAIRQLIASSERQPEVIAVLVTQRAEL